VHVAAAALVSALRGHDYTSTDTGGPELLCTDPSGRTYTHAQALRIAINGHSCGQVPGALYNSIVPMP